VLAEERGAGSAGEFQFFVRCGTAFFAVHVVMILLRNELPERAFSPQKYLAEESGSTRKGVFGVGKLPVCDWEGVRYKYF
jgi:hypothetical protein